MTGYRLQHSQVLSLGVFSDLRTPDDITIVLIPTLRSPCFAHFLRVEIIFSISAAGSLQPSKCSYSHPTHLFDPPLCKCYRTCAPIRFHILFVGRRPRSWAY